METRICYATDRYVESRHFYESVLGWKIYKEWDRSLTDKGVVYHAGSTLLEILFCPPDKASRVDGGLYLYIEVAELDGLHTGLEKDGHAVSPIEEKPWGHTSFSTTDPAGLPLKFFVQQSK